MEPGMRTNIKQYKKNKNQFRSTQPPTLSSMGN